MYDHLCTIVLKQIYFIDKNVLNLDQWDIKMSSHIHIGVLLITDCSCPALCSAFSPNAKVQSTIIKVMETQAQQLTQLLHSESCQNHTCTFSVSVNVCLWLSTLYSLSACVCHLLSIIHGTSPPTSKCFLLVHITWPPLWFAACWQLFHKAKALHIDCFKDETLHI